MPRLRAGHAPRILFTIIKLTPMDEETKKSLTEIINYLYHDEHKDYEASDGSEHHIFMDIQRVAAWLDNNT